MRAMSMPHWLANVLIVTLFAVVASASVRAQSTDDLEALKRQVEELSKVGKHADALPLAERAVALAERMHGAEASEVAGPLLMLGGILGNLNRLSEMEKHERRALAIREAALGPDHPVTVEAVIALAGTFAQTNRQEDAERFYRRALAVREKLLGPDHPDVGTSLNNLAGLYESQGRYAEAEPLYKRSVALIERVRAQGTDDLTALQAEVIRLHLEGKNAEAVPHAERYASLAEKRHGDEHAETATAIRWLAIVHHGQGHYPEAEPLWKRSLAIYEKVLGPNHTHVSGALNNLALLYVELGRHAEAEPLYRRSLAIKEAHGLDHPSIGTTLDNLANLYQEQGRYAEAESMIRRALALNERAHGLDHPSVDILLNNLGHLLSEQRRYAEAEQLYNRSLVITVKALGPEHPDVGSGLSNLASLYRSQGRNREAELAFKRALAIKEKTLGPHHPNVGTTLNNLASLYHSQGRNSEAESLYQRALGIREKTLGSDHPSVVTSLDNLGYLYFEQSDWERTANFWRRSTGVLVRRAQRDTDDVGQPLTGKRRRASEHSRFFSLVKTIYRLGEADNVRAADFARESFAMAQWAQSSEAAASVAQMAARGVKGDLALSRLIRQRQDLVGEWQKREGMRSAAVAQAPDKRDRAAEVANAAKLAMIDLTVAAIDKQLVVEFPDYTALSRPDPLSVEDVQSHLGLSEALVLFLDTPEWTPTPEETFVWVVTKTDMRWVRSELGSASLRREVAALRCGLDLTAWDGGGARRCGALLKLPRDKAPTQASELPFDTARAHALYTALFGQVEDLIKDKHLLLVPSRPLTQLPFQVLVTEPPNGADDKGIRWLARSHALTVLPAVSSLKALRRTGKPSAATKPMIGFGNPLLDGPDARFADLAAQARRNYSCGEPRTPLLVASLRSTRAPVALITTRGGIADVGHVRRQTPLPETADELCAVARDLQVDGLDIYLGDRATEGEIKALSASGALARYRIVHFATHGTLAGQLSGTSEPGLILTPPGKATEVDDGYLSAGEIAALKLDADWVILSACNTAGGAGSGQDKSAGGAGGAEALSGLARAFFYAGARALLVSHWEVDSDATVKLITHAVSAITRDKSIGRAEALRRAMLAMIDNAGKMGGKPHEAHPAFWAPFIVVGEGAAAR